jgi:hypothetical protein
MTRGVTGLMNRQFSESISLGSLSLVLIQVRKTFL